MSDKKAYYKQWAKDNQAKSRMLKKLGSTETHFATCCFIASVERLSGHTL
jgi:hypothetical protein